MATATKTIDQFTPVSALISGDIILGLRGGTTDLSIDAVAAINALAQAITDTAIPPGTFIESGAVSAPTGYLLADGSSVSMSTYDRLWTAYHTDKGVFTVTIASPAVVTLSAHGRSTGDSVYLTTTGALPTGLSTFTNYFVIFVSSSTFRLATSLSNALAGTAINTTGSQSGVHSLVYAPWGIASSTNFYVPDAREASFYGAGTRGSGVTAHDAAVLGQFKDDQFQGFWQEVYTDNNTVPVERAASAAGSSKLGGQTGGASNSPAIATRLVADPSNGTPRFGTVTRGKILGVNYYIKY